MKNIHLLAELQKMARNNPNYGINQLSDGVYLLEAPTATLVAMSQGQAPVWQ